MANQWFRFKQFEIQQDRCAMKVGTDSVILGAWTSVDGVRKALDIGAGTGLLSLMIAQRCPLVQIDAVEIDEDAAGQAAENVSNSPFSGQITMHHAGFAQFANRYRGEGYDLIISNPPYYTDAFRPPESRRSKARHDDHLSLGELFARGTGLLNPQGILSLVLPADRESDCVELADQNGLAPCRLLHVIPLPGVAPTRICIEFSRERSAITKDALVIETGGRHMYSAEYINLTEDFYL